MKKEIKRADEIIGYSVSGLESVSLAKMKKETFKPQDLGVIKIELKDWRLKLMSLIEKEIKLATGDDSKEHFSGDCLMNDIAAFVEKQKLKSYNQGIDDAIKWQKPIK